MANYDIEEKAEELLNAVGAELAKSRANYADEILSGKEIPLYAEPIKQKRFGRKRTKLFIILVAVLIMMMGLMISSVTGVNEKIFHYFAEKGSVSTEIRPFGQTDSEEGELPRFEFSYLPEGYSLSSEDYNGVMDTKLYESDGNKYIYMSVQYSKTYSASVDSEHLQGEMTRVNIYQAQLYYNDMVCYVVWQVGDYTMDIIGTVSKEEIIKIAESLKLLEA